MSSTSLNILAFVLTAVGSALGMYGAFKQANAYYPFKMRRFVEHIARVWWARRINREEVLKQIAATAELGQQRGEDRVQSLIGLYCLFSGFFLQLAGALFALLASLATAR